MKHIEIKLTRKHALLLTLTKRNKSLDLLST